MRQVSTIYKLEGIINTMKKMIIPIVLILLLSFSSVTLAAEASVAPAHVERRNVNEVEYIVKTFEISPDTDATELIEAEFEDGGFSFAHYTTTSEERVAEETKDVTKTVAIENQSKDLSEVLKKFAATLPYEQDGFTGTLILDTGSIVTEVAGYTAKTSTVSDTKEFTGMMYADPSALPQSTVKNGVTLPLIDVNWTVTGTSLAGDSLVPTEYKATAIYSKKISSQVPTGYVSTAVYRGEVGKTEVTSIVFALTYKGTLIPTPIPEPAPEPITESFPWDVLLKTLIVLLALGGGVIGVLYLRAKQGVRIFNLIGQDYLCIGRQRMNTAKPTIDLNLFADVVQSNFFAFVLDKTTSRKLFGRNISVTLGDIKMTHMVKDMNGAYRFNLEIGDGLDA